MDFHCYNLCPNRLYRRPYLCPDLHHIFQIYLNRYSHSNLGTHKFDTSPYFNVASANLITSLSYTGTTLNSHSASARAISSIDALNFQFPSSYSLNIISSICSTSGTTVIYCLDSNFFASLAFLSNRYLFIDSPLVNKVTDFYPTS